MPNNESQGHIEPLKCTGNVYIYYAYDVGDDINLILAQQSKEILTRPLRLSKYFKGYHVPFSMDLPHPHSSSHCIGVKVHSFGVISLAYKIPFRDTLGNLRNTLSEVDAEFRERSSIDAHSVYKKIRPFIKQSRFFHVRSSYMVIQVDQQPSKTTAPQLEKEYGGIIASLLRLETESLSEYQKNEILDSAIGYYRGDLIVIDTDSAFVYDTEYEELLDLFEFANIQELELQYYDHVLDQQLDVVYKRETRGLPFKAYLPFIGTWMKDPVSDLGMLQVEISSIVERLESAIKSAGDVYVTETYDLLVEKLDLTTWKQSVEKKLKIVRDIHVSYQNKIDIIREDLLSTLIILLIFIELIIGILSYFKK